MIMEEFSGKLDVTAPARGILASIESFTFLFGIMLGEDFFTIIDHLSRALQTLVPLKLELMQLLLYPL